MSDMDDDDMEDYGFEYSDESQEEEDVDIENQYYNSKGLLESAPEEALEGFKAVVQMEATGGGGKGEWGFKALKQVVKIRFKMGQSKEMLADYSDLLTYIKSSVTRNKSEKVINSVLDFVSSSSDVELLRDFYETTLRALAEAQNERLWFKTNLKLCKLWFESAEYAKLSSILDELHASCMLSDGTDDQKKGTQLLEVYAIEIQVHTVKRNNKRLKQLYIRALGIKSAIPHPRIMGIIRECGGKMHMSERMWDEAATDFFEAFKNYDEAGNSRRIQCLKYLVLAHMLMESKVNPFDAQEAKPYQQDPEIVAMTNMVSAYQRKDINDFEKILKDNRQQVMGDEFIRNYVEDLLRKIRTQVLLLLIQPYTKIGIPFIAEFLKIPDKDVEALLVCLILDNRITGAIDQVGQLLEVGDLNSVQGAIKYTNTEKWSSQLQYLHKAVASRV